MSRHVIQTQTQVFDVEIVKERNYINDGDHTDLYTFLKIEVIVGTKDPHSPHGSQHLLLRIPWDSDVVTVLRDWRDLIDHLPTAIMEHHL